MMTRQKLYTIVFLTIFLSISSCSGIKQLRLEKDRDLPISLGQIVAKEGVIKNNIEIKGAPRQVSKIQVSIVKKELKGAALKRYNKRQDGVTPIIATQDGDNAISYVEIELINDIEYARAINEDIGLKNYVQQSKKAAVVTKISCVFNNLTFELEGNAYLEVNEGAAATLVFYDRDNNAIENIAFKDIEVFDYQVSHFCYGKDNRGQIRVMDLVEDGKQCKKPLERRVKSLLTTKKLINY